MVPSCGKTKYWLINRCLNSTFNRKLFRKGNEKYDASQLSFLQNTIIESVLLHQSEEIVVPNTPYRIAPYFILKIVY